MDVAEKVMRTYGMMVNLNAADEAVARQKLMSFLTGKSDDEHKLTIEGIKYLRGVKPARTRRARS
jgi:hypothetical protein